MLACVDVSYGEDTAIAGCLLFPTWSAAAESARFVAKAPLAAPYRPGAFYLRELPPILAVLADAGPSIDLVVIDGYVWLDAAHPGLGARLHEALDARVAIVGVAKTAWGGAQVPAGDTHPRRIVPVTRGGSARPLFVTAEGIDVAEAAAHVAAMHGAHRLPTLLKAVDRLVRDEAKALGAAG